MAPESARLASAGAALPFFGAKRGENVPTLPVEVPAMAKKTAGVRVVAGSDAPFRGIVGEESGSGAASGGNGGEKRGTRGARDGDAGPCDGGRGPRLFGSPGLAPPPAKAGGG